MRGQESNLSQPAKLLFFLCGLFAIIDCFGGGGSRKDFLPPKVVFFLLPPVFVGVLAFLTADFVSVQTVWGSCWLEPLQF